jgi:DNA-binding CsgD family transcriptional regulator
MSALNRLDAESPTLQHALAWALDHDSDLAHRLAIALAAWWDVRSRWAEGYRLLTEASRHLVAGTDEWCTAENWLGYLSSFTNVPTSLCHVNALIDTLMGSGLRGPMLARALAGRATCLANLDRGVEAAEEARRALDLAAELGDPFGQAAALIMLGYLTWTARDLASTVAWFRRAQDVDLGAVPGWLARTCNKYLAGALGDAGELAEARHYCARSLELARQAGSIYDESSSLRTMAMIDVEDGNMASASTLLREAIGLYSRCGAGQLLLQILQSCVDVCVRTERWRETLTLISASDVVSQDTTQNVVPLRHDPVLTARAALGVAEAQAAEQRGAAMTPDAAAAYALEVLAGVPIGPDNVGLSGAPRLSARERELVLLVAEGRTDAQIASQLFISISTVRSHLDRIRDKTGCRRRADLTRLALQAGLI